MYPGATTRNNHRRNRRGLSRAAVVADLCSSHQVGPEPAVGRGSSADGRSSRLSPATKRRRSAVCCADRPAAGHALGRDPVRPRSGELRSGPPRHPHTPATATRPPCSRHIRHIQHANPGITTAYEGSTTRRSFTPATSSQHRMIPRRPSSPAKSTVAPGYGRWCRDRQPALQAPPPVPHSTAQPARPECRPTPDPINSLSLSGKGIARPKQAREPKQSCHAQPRTPACRRLGKRQRVCSAADSAQARSHLCVGTGPTEGRRTSITGLSLRQA